MDLINLAWTGTLECNLKCTHCYAARNGRQPSGLDTDIVKSRIIDPLSELSARYISFTGGEPLMRPDLFELLAYAKNRGLLTSLVTNGLLMPRMAAQVSTDLVDSLQVSLESHRPDINDQIRGAGVFKELVEQVFPLLRKKGLAFSIAMTPTPANEDSVEDLAELAIQIGAKALVVRRFLAVGGARKQQEGLFSDQTRHQRFLRRIVDLRERFRGRLDLRTSDPLFSRVSPDIHKYRDEKVLGGCTAGVASAAVGIDGTIKICTRVDYSLGNVTQDSLVEVWRSHEDLIRLRNRNNLKGHCGKCAERWICGGCRGVAFREFGDIFSEDCQCWD